MTHKGNKRSAKKRLAAFVVETNRKHPGKRVSGDWTFDELFAKWISARSMTTNNRLSASTVYREQKRYARHVKPVFGERKVESMTQKYVNDFYAALRDERKVPGEATPRPGLAPASVARIHEMIGAMCTWATNAELIAYNPVANVKRPPFTLPASNPPEHQVLDNLLQDLWRSDRKPWLAVRIAATTGARRSELIALRWNDVEFRPDRPTLIRIERGLLNVPHIGFVETDTKTGVEGTGSIVVDPELSDVLRQEWLDFLEVNKSAHKNGYLFSDKADGSVARHPDTLSTRLRKVVDRNGKVSGKRRITLKSLRAYVASELETLGNDATTAQAVLRHKSPLTTQRHYAAARIRKQRESTVQVGQQFTKRGRSKPKDAD